MKSRTRPRCLLLVVDFDKFADWLNLPPGIRIEAIEERVEFRGLMLRVTGRRLPPLNPQEQIPIVTPMKTIIKRKRRHDYVELLWWPALGQKEPKQRKRKATNAA